MSKDGKMRSRGWKEGGPVYLMKSDIQFCSFKNWFGAHDEQL
jgi:hypothetical protein